MKQVFTINHALTAYNEHENMARGSKYAASTDKTRMQNLVGWAIRAAKLQPVEAPQWVSIEWHEDISGKKTGRDPDNIASAKKFILDALKKQGIIKDDKHKYIAGFTDRFIYEKAKSRIIVTLTDYTGDE